MKYLAKLSGVASLVVLFAACSNGAVTSAQPPSDAGDFTDHFTSGAGIGQPCDATTLCRTGLACTAGKCAAGHSSGDGTPCVISAECKAGDYCGPSRTCAAGGKGADGDACKSDGDCGNGLRCDLVGLSAECKPEGTKDVGGTCTTSADCYGGLACAGGACAPLPAGNGGPVPLGIPTWKGADCKDDAGPTTAYFHVPRGTNDGDFYRLPFPNDVRMKGGHPDLSNHPTPGAELLGYDVVDRYLRYVEQSTDGFSTYPTVILRYSANVNFDSLKASGVVRYVDVTPGGSGNDLGYSWEATTGRTAYVCNNSMSVRPPMGAPLTPGSTYAVLIFDGARDASNQPIKRADDLTALLAGVAPTDAALAAGYTAYKPLRDWAVAKSVALATILDAAVFTVGHPATTATKLAPAVAAAAAPTASGWVQCGVGPSPCPQATGDRACGTPDPAFDELHALVTLPIFQKGTAPYATPDQGGGFDLAADGTPNFQRTESVCMSLTVPKGSAMPAGGWPLVIYAHGTGGSFRSHVKEGVAGRLASVDDGGAGQVHMAVLGIDQVEHGTRRGASTESPNNLFFNFANPSAARGNPLQGAADQMALVRFAQSLDLVAASSPTGAEIKFGAIAYWGHSQGATEGGIALPYTPGVVGAVLSGEGASLIDALVTKKSPVDIADVLPFVLEDAAVDTYHPVLSILQNAIDPADPLNHALALAAVPVAGGAPKHVFQPYGIGDTFAPPPTEQTFALVAGLGVAAPPASVTKPDAISGSPLIVVPASGNLTVGAKTITAIVREYQPSGYDGHFVAFQDPDAMKDVAHFLADAVGGKVPAVGR